MATWLTHLRRLFFVGEIQFTLRSRFWSSLFLLALLAPSFAVAVKSVKIATALALADSTNPSALQRAVVLDPGRLGPVSDSVRTGQPFTSFGCGFPVCRIARRGQYPRIQAGSRPAFCDAVRGALGFRCRAALGVGYAGGDLLSGAVSLGGRMRSTRST